MRIVGRFCGGGYALDGQIKFVDGIVLISCSVFDRAARQANLRGPPNGFGAHFGRAAEAILQIGGDRQMRCLDDFFRVCQNSIAR